MNFIGVMSGTSCDGVDMVLMDATDGISIRASAFYPFESSIKTSMLRVIADEPLCVSDFSRLDAQLGEIYANCVLDFLTSQGVHASDVQAIGLHGQTVYHDPTAEYANTLQIGSAARVAQKTGIVTVNNFRQMDVCYGGQGAPLAPIFHQTIFRQVDKNVLVLNLGGIANISLLHGSDVMGFDTGPANCLLDEWIMKHQSLPYDDKGHWASQGEVNQGLLNSMLQEPYFNLLPPKSTGRELFNEKWLGQHLHGRHDLPAVDVQRTLLQLTVETVASAIKMTSDMGCVVVCGGGVHNNLLMQLLQDETIAPVTSSAEFGIDPDFVEASLMAWLAMQNINQVHLNLSTITGAEKPLIYGVQNHP